MPATTANALKALIESLGLGLTAYMDQPPQKTKRPYVTVEQEIAFVPDPLEDAAPTTGVETAQIDLWQNWHDQPGGGLVTENYTLAPALRKGVHGQRLASIGTAIVYIVLVVGSVRVVEPDDNLVHHAITVEIHREL